MITKSLELAALVWLTLAAGCTAPVTADVLPEADARIVSRFDFALAPKAVKVIPAIEPLSLLATNPQQPRWAASDGRRVWVGEGEQLHELDRDYATQVGAMAIDDAGALWLIDGKDQLTRINPDAQPEQLPALPIRHVEALRVVGQRLVVLGQLGEGVPLPPDEPVDENTYLDEDFVIAISRDQGQTWELRRRPSNLSEFDDLSLAPDGSMQLMDGNEADCGGGWQARWRGHLDRPGWTELMWPLDTYAQRAVADHGWSYGLSECNDASAELGVCAVDRKGRVYSLRGVDSNYLIYLIIHDGARTMMLDDDGIWSISGRRATRVADGRPELLAAGIDGSAIAHDGAIMISAGSAIHIGSAAGWTRVELG